MEDLKVSGTCVCGNVEVNVTGKPMTASYCHCLDCQRSHSAPMFQAVIFSVTQVLDTLKRISLTPRWRLPSTFRREETSRATSWNSKLQRKAQKDTLVIPVVPGLRTAGTWAGFLPSAQFRRRSCNKTSLSLRNTNRSCTSATPRGPSMWKMGFLNMPKCRLSLAVPMNLSQKSKKHRTCNSERNMVVALFLRSFVQPPFAFFSKRSCKTAKRNRSIFSCERRMWKFIHRKKKTPSSKGSLAENAVAGGSFSVLPDEILLFVFSFLDIKSLVSVSMVDQRAHSIASEDVLWEDLYKKWASEI